MWFLGNASIFRLELWSWKLPWPMPWFCFLPSSFSPPLPSLRVCPDAGSHSQSCLGVVSSTTAASSVVCTLTKLFMFPGPASLWPPGFSVGMALSYESVVQAPSSLFPLFLIKPPVFHESFTQLALHLACCPVISFSVVGISLNFTENKNQMLFRVYGFLIVIVKSTFLAPATQVCLSCHRIIFHPHALVLVSDVDCSCSLSSRRGSMYSG